MTDMQPEIAEDLTEDEMAELRAGIGRGLEAAAAGNVRSAEDYKADIMKRRAERQDASQTIGKINQA